MKAMLFRIVLVGLMLGSAHLHADSLGERLPTSLVPVVVYVSDFELQANNIQTDVESRNGRCSVIAGQWRSPAQCPGYRRPDFIPHRGVAQRRVEEIGFFGGWCARQWRSLRDNLFENAS